MPLIELKDVLQAALQNVEQNAELQENDPSLLELKGNLVRTMAELEVARLQREQAAAPLASPSDPPPVPPSEPPQEDTGSPIAAVA